jgi:hypothetical protein
MGLNELCSVIQNFLVHIKIMVRALDEPEPVLMKSSVLLDKPTNNFQ